ncbi:MAG: hypothetical protein JSW71_02425 [Gemmatimonadota bacterium]|nr:MAG: hypothetical protein JSW71_02425 [Gemmatimonadota bacterium]
MNEPAKSIDKIRTICEERQQIELWLKRLAQAENRAPDHVKQKVEADYRQRLDEVLAELRSHRGEISEALESQRTVRDGLKDQEAEATERLAEAELRHTVGEFDETKWTETKTSIEESWAKIRDELEGVEQEVEELEDVIALIERGPRFGRDEEPGAEPLPQPAIPAVTELEDALDLGEDQPAAVEAEPAGEPEDITAGKTSLDELEFLRSVTEDASHGPAPERASGEMRIPEGVSEVDQVVGRVPATVGAEGVTSLGEGGGQPKKAAAKTLKCGECGSMNLPTEWYCERCGAELAAL